MALADTAAHVIKNVQTQGVGFAPILKHYFEKAAVARIIDEHVPTDPRRKALTHGQAAVAMITGILFQVMQLYRICPFARQTTVLDVILPGIGPEQYFDDRLADTLDAIHRFGIGDLELLLTRHLIDTFQIQNDVCHNDTTSVSFYGNPKTSPESILITFGHSKKHREDLKQLVWSMSVSSDSGFPLFQQAYSGNTADVKTYVQQWLNLIDLLGRRDFLYVADCKLISKENIAAICDNGGCFLAPAPMYDSYVQVFEKALAEHDRELLIPYKDRINRGFEVPTVICHGEQKYPVRMIVLFDHGLGRIKRQVLQNRADKTRQAFDQLIGKLNRRKLKTQKAIDKACTAVLNKYHTAAFFSYQITQQTVTTYKNGRRGRPRKNEPIEKVAVQTDRFNVQLVFDEQAFDAALDRCGYYPLLTNKDSEQLSIEQAMLAHKDQYKSEHTFRRAKGSYDLEPICLHFPERIESYLLLFKIALQIVSLVERTARRNIQQRDHGLDDFMPNRKDVRNPRAEYLLAVFQYIVIGLVTLPDGSTYGFVSELNELQLDILAVLEVPASCFSYNYLNSS